MPPQADDTLPLHGHPLQCPQCAYTCDFQDNYCPNCGSDLTQSLPSTNDLKDATWFALHNGKLKHKSIGFAPDATLVLQILPSQVCIPLSLQKAVVLGRKSSAEDTYPLIDLTELDARELGVSRHHCQLQRMDTSVIAIDLASRNKTYLNNHPLEPHQAYELAHGDRLCLGRLYVNILFGLTLND